MKTASRMPGLRALWLFMPLLTAPGHSLAESLQPMAAQAHTAAPDEWTATYRVLRGNSTIGEATFRLESVDGSGTMLLESRTSAKGIAKLLRSREVVESSTFVAGQTLRPLAYRFEDGTRKGKKNMHIDFDFSQSKATSLYQGDSYALPLEPGTLDRLLVILVMMRHAAQNTVAQAYRVADKREVKTYYLEGPTEEALQTPAGQFDTLQYRRLREGSSRAMEIWLAPRLDYLPVRMRHLKDGKETARLELITASQLP